MSKRKYKTTDTARKSTSTSSAMRRTPTETQNEFARAETRIISKIEARCANDSSVTYRGPVGMGRGKGAIRRIRRSITWPEIKTSMSRVSGPGTTPPRSPSMRGDDVPLAQFARYVKHLMDTTFAKLPVRKLQVVAIEAMRMALESYAVRMFETSNMLVQHCGRVTVMTKDLALYKRVEKSQALNVSISGANNTGGARDAARAA